MSKKKWVRLDEATPDVLSQNNVSAEFKLGTEPSPIPVQVTEFRTREEEFEMLRRITGTTRPAGKKSNKINSNLDQMIRRALH
jgi:hypothetical protein